MRPRTWTGAGAVTLLTASALTVLPHNEVFAEAPADIVAMAGATTPFVTVEAETGTLGGAARKRSISAGAPAPTAANLETRSRRAAPSRSGRTPPTPRPSTTSTPSTWRTSVPR